MKLLKWGFSYWRIVLLKIRWGRRLKVELSWRRPLYIGRRCKLYIGQNAQVEIQAGAYLAEGVEINAIGGAKVLIGKMVYIGKECCLVAREGISIGECSLLAPRVGLYDHNHSYREDIPIAQQGVTVEKIIVGDNSWLCMNSFITKGVQFHNRLVLSANSVLNKQNLEYTDSGDLQIYIGNPAERVK